MNEYAILSLSLNILTWAAFVFVLARIRGWVGEKGILNPIEESMFDRLGLLLAFGILLLAITSGLIVFGHINHTIIVVNIIMCVLWLTPASRWFDVRIDQIKKKSLNKV